MDPLELPPHGHVGQAHCVARGCAIRQVCVSIGRGLPTGTTLAFVGLVIDSRWLPLTDLWSLAIDVHDQRPLTRSAALAALAVGSEDHRRRELGIPSIFEPPPLALDGRGAP